ncbi:MAG: sulfur reduction protein DsrE [Bacteroidales bacterium]|nr:sulfur reduction protein DsrE [Bacteroidales bacterium]
METNEKIVIITITGGENPEKATIPFVMATAAQATDVVVSVILQSNSVVLAKKGEAEKVVAPEFMPVKQLIDAYIEMGGKLLLCSPCLKERNITRDYLIDGCEIIAAGTVISEVLSAKAVLTY